MDFSFISVSFFLQHFGSIFYWSVSNNTVYVLVPSVANKCSRNPGFLYQKPTWLMKIYSSKILRIPCMQTKAAARRVPGENEMQKMGNLRKKFGQ